MSRCDPKIPHWIYHLIQINRPCTTHFIYSCHCPRVINLDWKVSIMNIIKQSKYAAFSSYYWDSSDEKSSPALLPTIDAQHPAKDASVFNTIDILGLEIGTKESIILLFHQYTFALFSFENIINLSKLPLIIFNVLVLFTYNRYSFFTYWRPIVQFSLWDNNDPQTFILVRKCWRHFQNIIARRLVNTSWRRLEEV